ncbi:hypothetical protein ACHWQZ_G007292 [Mnemiopsis leidyi]
MLKSTVILTFVVLCVFSLKYETLKVRVSQSAVDFINEEIRAVIPTVESELQNFPLPEVSGNDYRLYNLKLQSSNIGSSSINFQDNGLRLKLNNNYFVLGGSFWIRKIIGIKGNVKITAADLGVDTIIDFHYNQAKSLSLQYCRVNIGRLDINLYNPILNFILGILGGAIRDQARRVICQVVESTAIPSINKALANLPADYDIGKVAKIKFAPGYINVNSQQLVSSYFAAVQPVRGEVDWKFKEQSLPSGGYTGQCCVWVSDHLLNTALSTLMPPGKIQTTLNVAEMGGLPAALEVELTNSAAPVVSLNAEKVYLTTGMNVSLFGEDGDGCRLNLGHYSSDFYLHSDTDITYDELRDLVKEKINYELPLLEKREVCVDNHENCAWWAGRGECKANPGWMLQNCKKSCKVCSDEEDKVKQETNPVEYLLNVVLPSREYVQFYDAKSDMLNDLFPVTTPSSLHQPYLLTPQDSAALVVARSNTCALRHCAAAAVPDFLEPDHNPSMFHLLHYGLMPRVVQDQSHKFETDELFRKLSEDTEIRVTSYRDKSPEERSQRFINDCKEGHTCVFYPPSGPTDKVTKEYVDFDKDPSKVVLKSRFIMNGVCVQLKGWIDLKRLDGVARLEFDYDLADYISARRPNSAGQT